MIEIEKLTHEAYIRDVLVFDSCAGESPTLRLVALAESCVSNIDKSKKPGKLKKIIIEDSSMDDIYFEEILKGTKYSDVIIEKSDKIKSIFIDDLGCTIQRSDTYLCLFVFEKMCIAGSY